MICSGTASGVELGVVMRMCRREDASSLARLHRENLSDQLGMAPLEAYYRACLASASSFCLCAEVGDSIVAFVGVISDRVSLMQAMLRHESGAVLACVFERPSLILELFSRACRWLRFPAPTSAGTRLAHWEYRPVVVARQYRGQRIVQQLLIAAGEMLAQRGVEKVHLWVDRHNFDAVRAYKRCGFYPAGCDRSTRIPMVKELVSARTTPRQPASPQSAASGQPKCLGISNRMNEPGVIRAESELNEYGRGSDEVVQCPLCFRPGQQVLLRRGSQSLRRCAHCGVRFAFPQPSPAALEIHFENGGTTGFVEPETSFERNRQHVLSRVAGYIRSRKSDGHILDVGCATGFFLSRFFADSAWRRSAVELSHCSARLAAARNIEVFTGTLLRANFSNDQFDVVTVLDTLYYFPRPQSELAEIRRVLRPDGFLVLELPLAPGRIWRTSNRFGRLLSLRRRPLLETSDHLFYYDRKAIALLLESCGFLVQEILPLPANRQARLWRDAMYRLFSLVSAAGNVLSGSRVFLGPRFLVIAAKEDLAGVKR